jgi:hypothetical protein
MPSFARFRAAARPAEAPFRDELLSIERLEERARSLAARFTLAPALRFSRVAFPRLEENARVLRSVYNELADDVHHGEFVTGAAEWLLDNYAQVDSELQRIRRNLPRGYYRELPRLAARESLGTARVYALAVEIIRHSAPPMRASPASTLATSHAPRSRPTHIPRSSCSSCSACASTGHASRISGASSRCTSRRKA